MDTDVRQLLSLARTALDDPGGLPEEALTAYEEGIESELDIYGSIQGPSVNDRYAIDRLDDAMRLLDVELRPKTALVTTGKLIAEIADDLEDSPAPEAQELAAILHDALDRVDAVIEQLADS